MDARLFPVTAEFFDKEIRPLIEEAYIWKGRPPMISHYPIFCALLYILRVGCPWRDLPKCYGNWHTIFQRFHRGNEKGLWWHILLTLQKRKKIRMNIVLGDSITMKVHRHGGGQKGGFRQKA